MSNKKYRLLKDTPDCPANRVGEWDESANAYRFEKIGAWVSPHRYLYFTKGAVECSPDWFQEVVELVRIEVSTLEEFGFSDHGNWYRFHIAATPGQPWPTITPTQLDAIKLAIEAILNNIEFHNFPGFQRVFTEADIDKARREGFYAAKEVKEEGDHLVHRFPTYKTYEDYKKSLNK